MAERVEAVMQRVQRYWYEDGVVELLLGGAFILVAVTLAAFSELSADGSELGLGVALMGVLVVLVVGASVVGIGNAVPLIKERLTYPRTGYVGYRREDPASRRFGTVILPAILYGLMVLSFLIAPDADQTLALFPAVGLCAVLVFFGLRHGVSRFYVLAILSLVAGGAALAGDGMAVASAMYFGLMGPVLLIAGAVTLRAYLRHNPPVEER